MFYVIEFQTNAGTGSVIPFTFSSRNEAEAKYHDILTYASVSSVDKHGAMIFTEDGFILKSEIYNHVENAE